MSGKSYFLFCVIFALTGEIYSEQGFFDDFYKCKVGPTFNECLTKAMNIVFPKLKDGKEEYQIQPLDPLKVGLIEYDQKSTGAVQVRQTFDNNTVYNFGTKTKFTSIKADLEKSIVTIEFTNPSIRIDGDFKLNGKILLLPINSHGRYNSEILDFHGKFNLKFKTEQRDGKTYWHFTRIQAFLNPTDIKLHVDNLVEGQKELTEQLNQVLNDNWRDFWTEVEPSYAKAIGGILLELINKAFRHIPVDLLLN